VEFREMDPDVTLRTQMDSDLGPVVLVNKFVADPSEAEQLEKAWAIDAAFMKGRPGFISTLLHRDDICFTTLMRRSIN
jgi:predicted metal-dependent HD superfamily phosphohydrolase